MRSKSDRTVIVVKKPKRRVRPHSGGAWKVAYADFVTAMMAFFMVMWIIGMDDSVRRAIEGYFQNPIGFREGQTPAFNPLEGGFLPDRNALTPIQLVARQLEEQHLREIGERIQMKLRSADGLEEIAAQIEIILTEQGLRIELVEGPDGETFFAAGSARLTPSAARALQLIAGELRASPTPIVVEGHTDAAPYANPGGYSNWELSADRANIARQSMESAGLGAGRVAEIRGHADRQLRVPENPFDNSNRRISILLPFATSAAVGDLTAAGS